MWVPTESVEVSPLVAPPPDNVTAEPKFEPSILNWTVPVGVPEPGATALTVAVKVTGWPETEVLSEELIVVDVFALLTAWVKFAEVLPLKLLSPL